MDSSNIHSLRLPFAATNFPIPNWSKINNSSIFFHGTLYKHPEYGWQVDTSFFCTAYDDTLCHSPFVCDVFDGVFFGLLCWLCRSHAVRSTHIVPIENNTKCCTDVTGCTWRFVPFVAASHTHTGQTAFIRLQMLARTGATSVGLVMILSRIRFDELQLRLRWHGCEFNGFFRCDEFTNFFFCHHHHRRRHFWGFCVRIIEVIPTCSACVECGRWADSISDAACLSLFFSRLAILRCLQRNLAEITFTGMAMAMAKEKQKRVNDIFSRALCARIYCRHAGIGPECGW